MKKIIVSSICIFFVVALLANDQKTTETTLNSTHDISSQTMVEVESGGAQNLQLQFGDIESKLREIWTQDQDRNIFYTDGGVGIGVQNVAASLHVAGSILFSDFAGSGTRMLAVTNEGFLVGMPLPSGGESLWQTGSGGRIYYNGGNVGIGITNPTVKLDVNGSIKAQNFFTNNHGVVSVGNTHLQLNDNQNQTVIGFAAGHSGKFLTAIGAFAGNTSPSTSFQTTIGAYAGSDNLGIAQTSIGVESGSFNTGDYQTAIGYRAGRANGGHRNISIGFETSYYNTGNDVIAIGYEAGKQNSLHNQFIVHQANINNTPLMQGNFQTGFLGIGTKSPTQRLHVDGNARITGSIWIGTGTTGTQTITANRIGRFADGTATQPAYSFTNSISTGIFRPVENQMGFSTAGTERIRIDNNGNVGIGTTNPSAKLTVNGKILATEVEVVSQIQSDFVFEPDYELMSIYEVERFVKENKHLPDVPSMYEFAEKGQNLAQVQDILLRKVEELTLYIIQLQKEIDELKSSR